MNEGGGVCLTVLFIENNNIGEIYSAKDTKYKHKMDCTSYTIESVGNYGIVIASI